MCRESPAWGEPHVNTMAEIGVMCSQAKDEAQHRLFLTADPSVWGFQLLDREQYSSVVPTTVCSPRT